MILPPEQLLEQPGFDFMEEWRADTKPLHKTGEIEVDLFCGGGGASVGIEAATGGPVAVAVNHSNDAIYYHERNHPGTRHYQTDVFDIHPLEVTFGRKVGLLWLSPDCTHFSKAKGAAPKKKHIRSLATVGLHWARQARPRIICLENVEEFMSWGPLLKNGQPDPRREGKTFLSFVRRLEAMGYVVEWKVLRACDYGAPTIRKRFFLVARCDGEPIRWPKPTHGPVEQGRRAACGTRQAGRLKPFRTAAECIDFSLPTVSIFASRAECRAAGINAVRPLADNTMQRIARGLWKFVLNHPDPFIVPQEGAPFITEMANGSSQRNMPADEPLRTICAQVKGGHFAQVCAFLEQQFGCSTGADVKEPLRSVTASVNKQCLVAAHIERMRGTSNGDSIAEPLGCVTGGGQHYALMTSHLMKYHTQQGGEDRCHDLRQPLPTVDGSNRFAEVRAFLVKYYGQSYAQGLNVPLDTITGNDRFGLVTVRGVDYRIVDIGLRMLTPAELLRAQFGRFAEGYKIDGLTKTKAVKMIGNSVCPDLSYALVKANYRRKSSRQLAATQERQVA